MKAENKPHQEFDDLLNSIRKPGKVNPPEDLLHKVQQKIDKTSTDSPFQDYLKWAALWLILLVNIASYYTFIQTPREASVLSHTDTELQLLVDDYDFEDNLYEESIN